MLNSKILTSGCGITFGQQEKKTWTNVLQAVGVQLIDTSGPAVSNQWIINQAIEHLIENQDITHVVIQLTSLGKLDVEVNTERVETLVTPDPIRNFTYKHIWPSSASTTHVSKQLWNQWLSSPGLELQEIFVKLHMLNDWCKARGIKLLVYQGYQLNWPDRYKETMLSLIQNIEVSWMQEYESKSYYSPGTEKNTVPVLEFHIDVAKKVAQDLQINIGERLNKLSKAYHDKKT